MLAVLEAVDADLPAAGLDALRRHVVDGDEGSIVDAGLDEFLGELGADARRGGVGIDGVLDDAETLARLQVLVLGAHGGRIDQREAGLIGLERRAEHVAIVEPVGHRGQRVGARRGGARKLVGVVGRRRRHRAGARRSPGRSRP